MNKKQLFLWSLYDFANSIVFINFLLYFGQWLVIDGGLSDFWYNAIFAITSIILFLTAPSLAAITDKKGGRKLFLNISTIGTLLSYGGAALLVYFHAGNIFTIAGLFLVGQYFYQLSFVFYNPMIDEVADLEHRSRASGIGQFANSFGQVVGLLVTLPLSGSRIAPLLPSVGLFFILVLPTMIYFKETKKREPLQKGEVYSETKIYFRKMIAFFSVSVATPLLVGYFFFNDALVTISNNYPIYMERVFATPDSTKSLLLMGVLIMSAIGGVVAGWVGDRIGSLKTLKIILIGWIILLPTIALSYNFTIFTIVTVAVGLLLGSVFAIARAYLSVILAPQEIGYGFSFYTLAERFATLIGPLAWGSTIWILGTGAFAYRVAMAVMAVFVGIGFLILSWWKRSHSHN